MRYAFAPQYLMGAALFAARAREIEDTEDEASITSERRTEHRAYVVSAFMQSVAALEAEISEILMYGPNHHLGSNHFIKGDNDFLKGIAENLEGNSTLDKYSAVLHLLKKPQIKDKHYYQNAKLVTQVRNELVHYKSKSEEKMSEEKLFRKLDELGFAKPKFSSPNTNFFPERFLSASSASWAVSSVGEFLNHYFDLLGIKSPFEHLQIELKVPSIITV